MPGQARARATGAASAVRGVTALLVLLVLGVGIPVGLIATGSLSHLVALADPARLRGALLGPDDGTLFVAVLSLVAWLGWATFAVAVAVEVPAQLRGVAAVRVRGLGVQQSLAGALVAAALAVVLVPGAANAAERPHVAAGGSATASVVPRADPPPSGVVRGSASPVADPGERDHGGVHVVRRGDTLWDLAESYLGDGRLWRSIARLNYDRTQPDGARLDRSHVLQPGWRLTLPPQVSPVSSNDSPTGAHGRDAVAGHTRVVRSGDTLSGIAREELGSEDRWPEIVEASASLREPDGTRFADPDRIYPGWTVRIPDHAEERPAAHPSRSRAEPPERDSSAPAATSPTVTPPARPATAKSTEPGGVDPSWPGQDPPGPRSGHASVSVEPGGNAHSTATRDETEAPELRTVGGVGGLLAGGVLVLLAARRARQQRRRRPGQRIPLPPPSVLATEATLRAVADPAGVEHIDLALRALAANHRSLGRPLPGLRSARLTPTHLELYLAVPARLPAPWTPTSDPTVWALGHDELTAQPETDLRAPYPSLVTVGHDLEGAHVLLDLEQAGALAVAGPRSETMPTLAAIAVELATSPWADDLLVTLVGCLPELPPAVATGRLRHVDRVEQLIADLEGRAADVARLLEGAGVRDLAAARGTGVADDAWPPEIVVLPGDVPDPLRRRLEHLVLGLPRVGIAAVTAGEPLGEWILQLDGDALGRLEPLGLALRPQRLSGAEYEDLLAILATADAEPVSGPAWAAGLPSLEQALAELPSPQPPAVTLGDDGDDAGAPVSGSTPPAQGDVVPLAGRPPYVRLFGAVEVVGATGPEPVSVKDGRNVANHVGRATALVAYLACRPQGASIEQVADALSPVRRLTPNTVWSLASRTRKWLGSDPDGNPYFPRTADAGVSKLHPAVRTDWADWVELVGDDVMATPLARLVAALQLVRGRPFEGVPERHFVWAEPLRQEMLAGVVDVAHEVVRRALLVPDVAAARHAVGVGRLLDPGNEMLWRDALRIEYVAGNPESRQRLVDQLYALAEDLDADLEPETEALVAKIQLAAAERTAGQ